MECYPTAVSSLAQRPERAWLRRLRLMPNYVGRGMSSRYNVLNEIHARSGMAPPMFASGSAAVLRTEHVLSYGRRPTRGTLRPLQLMSRGWLMQRMYGVADQYKMRLTRFRQIATDMDGWYWTTIKFLHLALASWFHAVWDGLFGWARGLDWCAYQADLAESLTMSIGG